MVICETCLNRILSVKLFTSFLEHTMVVKEMSLRNRLSKSSENPEEKEDGGSPTKEPRDSPSDGETFHFCEVNE